MNKLKSIFKNRKSLGLLLVLIVVGFFVWKSLKSKNISNNLVEQKTIVQVMKGNITSGIISSGHVETANYLPITTSVNGIVKKVYVKEGDTVVKGQKIMDVTLNADGEESYKQALVSYLSAKNAVDQAKTNLISKKSSLINATEAFENEKKSNSYQSHDERVSYELAENAYKVAKNEYDQQQNLIIQSEANLQKAWLSYQAQSPTIVASDNGTIANIVVVEGMDISNSLSERTSASVASIKKDGTPIVSLSLSELDINKVHVGQKVQINVSSLENKTFDGTVVGIDKIGSINNNVSTYPVIVRFTDSSDLVLPNMGVEANIVINSKEDVLVVPTSAVTSQKRKTYVDIFKNGNTVKTEFKAGISDGVNTEVLEGLSEGDQVFVKSLPVSGFVESQKAAQSQRNVFRGGGVVFGR